jgi:tetratricopeptide (TPR) repeat protein
MTLRFLLLPLLFAISLCADTNATRSIELDAANRLPAEIKKVVPKGTQDELQSTLEMARNMRFQKNFEVAEKQAKELLADENPPEIRRLALLELAYIAQDALDLGKAQQIYGEYMHRYPKDPSVPEVCLRQGLLYRQMGVHTQALSKFYQVMNYALTWKLDKLDYYQALVLQAQTEIAETYFLQGKYGEASDYFSRLLKLDGKGLDRPVCLFKLIRSLSAQKEHDRVAAQAQSFVQLYPDSIDVPEVRFMLADSLKKLGRNRDSMQQVLLLLQSQQAQATAHPEIWAYWQQRTGNEIANELYKEGDYMSALEIYTGLAKLNNAPGWQLPVWYQIGLVFEHLKQPAKAADMYQQILKRQMEVRTDAPTASLLTMLDMAQWRLGFLKWNETTDKNLQELRLPAAPAPELKDDPTAASAPRAAN